MNRTNATRDFYNEHAEKWAAEKNDSSYHEAEFRKFHDLLKEGNIVLDIGCASGIHVPLFLGIGEDLRYEGLDISETFLRLAKSRYPQLAFFEGDVLDETTLPDKKYDAFWAAAVLMHISKEDWPEMMENIENIMQPGAVGYLTVPTERYIERDERHFTVFEEKEFKALLGKRNWEILQRGKKEPTRSTAWSWFIVKLPV
ncbi:MAG: hypothetical protein QOE22_410 [Candidatus Parcubacteria bacterium]|jgi:SAM-dependent methyltransferase|nr:hypothetical protein [Candidatus Parcubacteria bacterium]